MDLGFRVEPQASVLKGFGDLGREGLGLTGSTCRLIPYPFFKVPTFLYGRS